eukprot:Hpha_TRINITY_DN15606_c1_g17::TRINITY_DN15606_c1_g17_i1::g.100791::m.100791
MRKAGSRAVVVRGQRRGVRGPDMIPSSVSNPGKAHSFGYNHYDQHFIQPGAQKGQTSIWWPDHVPEEGMVGTTDHWTHIPKGRVPSQDEFGVTPDEEYAPPGAYPGVNRDWIGFKPSRWRGGYYGSGIAARDSWGPDQNRSEAGQQAQPETVIDRVSVDWFLDEFSVPKNKHQSVMSGARGAATQALKINKPWCDNALDAATMKTLYWETMVSTHSPLRKITMIGACQNGHTEWWCKGLMLDDFARLLRFLVHPPPDSSKAIGIPGRDDKEPTKEEMEVHVARVQRMAGALLSSRNTPTGDEDLGRALLIAPDCPPSPLRMMAAARYHADWQVANAAAHSGAEGSQPNNVVYVNEVVRWAMKLLWVVGNGATPTLSIVNGKCANIGSGLALLCNFAAIRDEASYSFSESINGLTPIGGLLRLLVSEPTEVKYPGLAEYMVLTGAELFHGDAKRLGWTSVHAPTDTHLNERMVQDYMNIHPVHDSGDGRRFLHALLFGDSDQAPEMDRCAISYERMEWIRAVFHGAESIIEIESRLEALRLKPSSDLPASDNDVSQREWAETVLYEIQRRSPFAQAVSLEMVKEARKNSLNLPECLALEYRCFVRMLRRSDFIKSQTTKEGYNDGWEPDEKDSDPVEGPIWSPFRPEDVDEKQVRSIVTEPLDWARDGTVELWLPVEASDPRMMETAEKHLGVEVVDGLGSEPGTATPDRAWVPTGVNVYREARHPLSGVVTSEREAVPPQSQVDYRRAREKEAAERLKAGLGRRFSPADGAPDMNASAEEAFEETPREVEEREARRRWNEMRMAAEKACGSESAAWVARGVDVGGERVLSPGVDEFGWETPFAPRTEPVYGRIDKYGGTNILTHFYDHNSDMPPKLVRNWDSLEAFVDQHRQSGSNSDTISRLVAQSEL